MSIPEVTDLKREPKHILEEYGATSSDKTKNGYARNCILARRLLERGVRVVQLFNGATTPIKQPHAGMVTFLTKRMVHSQGFCDLIESFGLPFRAVVALQGFDWHVFRLPPQLRKSAQHLRGLF